MKRHSYPIVGLQVLTVAAAMLLIVFLKNIVRALKSGMNLLDEDMDNNTSETDELPF